MKFYIDSAIKVLNYVQFEYIIRFSHGPGMLLSQDTRHN